MNIKKLKIIFGVLLLGASVAVLLSLTVFSDIHKIEKIEVSQKDGLSYYTDKKGSPLDGVVMIEDHANKGARINIPVKNGRRNGVAMQFNIDAKKVAEFPFVDGVLDGPMKYFEPDGSIAAISMYKGGKKNGNELIYIEEKRASEAQFADGALVKFTRFGPDEKVSYEIIRTADGQYEEWEYIRDGETERRIQLEYQKAPHMLPDPVLP